MAIDTRGTPGAKQCERVRRPAQDRLAGDLQAPLLAVLVVAEASRVRRNGIVHQDWLLRDRDAMPPVAELGVIEARASPAYLEEWERESKTSQGWQRVLARSMEVAPAQTLEQLRRVEREIAAATVVVSELIFRVASSRETGHSARLHPFGLTGLVGVSPVVPHRDPLLDAVGRRLEEVVDHFNQLFGRGDRSCTEVVTKLGVCLGQDRLRLAGH